VEGQFLINHEESLVMPLGVESGHSRVLARAQAMSNGVLQGVMQFVAEVTKLRAMRACSSTVSI
jgi:hypothetical protein